ncbi:MAG TPA: glutamate-1-semialdehyde 2,1-aminomutase [Verrucomicrobiales bacterium]|nr:glutamate-1-semialdehyde 2,1-aminomutase [Verrucomicrobiales bacterium]
MSLSSKLFSMAKQFIPGGVNSPVRAFRNVGGEPFFVRRAKGCRIEDVDGREMIDYVGTWGPAILGHAPDVLVRTVHETAKNGLSFGIPNPWEVEMARTICEWVPSVQKVRMCSSGTEATMSCIRLARGFTGRERIVKFHGCYHGHVDSLLVSAGSGALTHGRPDSAGVPAELARLTTVLQYNDAEALEELFAAQGDEIAAVIVEAVPANAGLFLPRSGYVQRMRDLTAKHGTLLIFDEVMTGFRVARGGYQELCGLTPDLTALGKVIGGGLPVGAFGGRAEIMDRLSPDGPVYQAGTLSGNPLAMAVGLAQLRELEKVSGWSRLEELGALFESGIREICQEMGRALTFNRIGSMFCLYFTEEPVWNLDDAKRGDAEAFKRFFHKALELGVYFAPSPYEAGFLSLAHGPADIDQTMEVCRQALKHAFQ